MDYPPTLSRADALAYLIRIGLPASTLDLAPSLTLLRDLQLSHLLSIPLESISLHATDTQLLGDPSTPITLGGGTTLPLGEQAFQRLVHGKRGGYCFTLNGTFASFIRAFRFRVSEMAGAVFVNLGKDPKEVGWEWGSTSHEVLLVDWEGCEEGKRWFVDVGLGGGQCPYPIPLEDGATMDSITPGDSYVFKLAPMPLTDFESVRRPDQMPHWTLYRLISKPNKRTFLSPQISFPFFSVNSKDFVVYNHYNSTHPKAFFVTFFVCSILKKDGSRRSIYYKEGMEKEGHAKLTSSGFDFGPNDGENLVEWVEMKAGPIRDVLVKEFGFPL